MESEGPFLCHPERSLRSRRTPVSRLPRARSGMHVALKQSIASRRSFDSAQDDTKKRARESARVSS